MCGTREHAVSVPASASRMGFGLVGAGIVGTIHARNLAAHPRAVLHWVVDVDAPRAQALAQACGAQAGTTLDAMLADPRVEIVIVASSTGAHEAQALACVAAGKALLCEKPLADSLEGARRVLAAARAARVPAAVGFNRRFDAHHRLVHDRVRAGEIGRVETLHLVSRSPALGDPAASARSGGLLRDKGTHHYDLACWLAAAEPVEIYASGGCLFEPRCADHGDIDTAALVLRFDSGAIATFSFSRRSGFGCDEMIEVAGERGLLQSGRVPAHEVRLYQGDRISGASVHPGWHERFAPTYVAEIDAIVEAVCTGRPSSPSLADGMRAQAVAEAAVASLVAGRPVAIADTWSAP